MVAQRDGLLYELRRWKSLQEFPPGHYYSPIPHEDDIARIVNGTKRAEIAVSGIDARWNEQLELFRKLSGYYKDLPFGDLEADRGVHRYYFENGFYSYADGILLYGLLRHLKPKRLVEVGSGFSSCLALDVNELFLNGAMNCTFIEPNPDRLLSNIQRSDRGSTTILAERVQDVDVSLFATMERDDILFIDSSHVGKAGSDVNFLFFEIMPKLNEGVWIHLHDVFYPFEYPKEWLTLGRSWNEAYLLHAFLMYNTEFALRLWGDAIAAKHRDVVETLMPKCLRNTGGGIWLQRQSKAKASV